MTFIKNPEYFQNDTFLETIIIKIFRDNIHFLKHRNSVNIFNDTENLIGESIPRLESFTYSLPQFVSLFLNKEKLESSDFRNFILTNIQRDSIIDTVWEKEIIPSFNPFLSEDLMDNTFTGNIQDIIKQKCIFHKRRINEEDSRNRWYFTRNFFSRGNYHDTREKTRIPNIHHLSNNKQI